MTLAAAELYPDFVAELEAASGVATGYVATAPSTSRSTATRRRSCAASTSCSARSASAPSGCRRAAAASWSRASTPSFNGGVHAAAEGAVDPRALAAALLAAAGRGRGCRERAGDRVLRAAARRRAARRRAHRRRRGAARRARSSSPPAPGRAGPSGCPSPPGPPVRPVKGQILELRARDGAAPCRRIVASERVYLVPRPDGRLIVGATVEEQGFDTAVTAGGVHELLREAYRLLPEVAEMELVEAAAGLRPGTPDNLPLVGPAPLDGLRLGDRPLPQRDPAGAADRRRDRRPARGGARMRIELNGEPRELPAGATLADAVRAERRRGRGARRRRRARRRGRAALGVGGDAAGRGAKGRGARRDPGRRRGLGARRQRNGPRG